MAIMVGLVELNFGHIQLKTVAVTSHLPYTCR